MAYTMLLAVNFTEERVKKLKLLCMLTKSKLKTVQEEEKKESLGTLLGLSEEDIAEIAAMRKEEKEGEVSHEEDVQAMAEHPVTKEALILCGFASAQVNQLLEGIRRGALKQVPLKAMVTPNNISWTIERVLWELSKEHDYFKNQKENK